jgi:predicted PurR-regulated permease PerM
MFKLEDVFNSTVLKKISSILFVLILLYFFRGMLNLLLLIFIITFILGQLQKFIYDKLNIHFKVSRKIITIVMYLVIVSVITVTGVMYIPKVTQQLIDIIKSLSTFDINQFFKEANINQNILNLISENQLDQYVKAAETQIVSLAATVGTFTFNLAISFLISFLFLLEKDEFMTFIKHMEDSKVAFLYTNIKVYGRKFLNSFGKVIELQIVIALINSVLSVIALSIMGFPQALGLGFMIFILGLIPVAGVLISLIPLCIIAFNIGGFVKIIEVIVMIVVLHSLESYILNPKLMSSKTKLPVFLVFIILLFSEHYLGVWGLLFGIPLFIFLLDVLDINIQEKPNKKE